MARTGKEVDLTMLQVTDLALTAGQFQLRDVGLRVEAGEYFALMGPTGSGKSLLIKAICGLIRIAAGSVELAGRDVTHLEPRRRRVGYVPQESGLFEHLTVERNIIFAPRVAGLSRRRAAEQVAPIVEMLGIGGLMGRSTLNLSGGERQKVALARALVRKPDLLVLDEPVSALDGPSRLEICGVLKRVQSELGVTALHVCHNMSEAHMLADRVGVMSAGRLIQIGTMDDLAANPADPIVANLLGGGDSAEVPPCES